MILERHTAPGYITLALDAHDRHALVLALEDAVSAHIRAGFEATHRDLIAYYRAFTALLELADDPLPAEEVAS